MQALTTLYILTLLLAPTLESSFSLNTQQEISRLQLGGSSNTPLWKTIQKNTTWLMSAVSGSRGELRPCKTAQVAPGKTLTETSRTAQVPHREGPQIKSAGQPRSRARKVYTHSRNHSGSETLRNTPEDKGRTILLSEMLLLGWE